MASSSNFLTHSITQAEFNLFHSIDRRLFSILIYTLRKDPTNAIHVMALWLYLERVFLRSSIVSAILSMEYSTIDALFEESMLCIHVAIYGPVANGQISVLDALLKGKSINVSLSYFHENNTMVLDGVNKIVEDVCIRAFYDILDDFKDGGSASTSGHRASDEGTSRQNENPFDAYDSNPFENIGSGSNVGHGVVEGGRVEPDNFNFDAYNALDFNDYDEPIEDNMQEDIEEMFTKINHLKIDEKTGGEDRFGEAREPRGSNKTLFLTFSKGYPISQAEVEGFFNRLFGDIIERLQMQEVQGNEQPLYARLEVRDVSDINLVLRGSEKIKFSINGKHIFVRKYISPPANPF